MPPIQPQNSPEDHHQGKHHNKPLFFVALALVVVIAVFAAWYGIDQQKQAQNLETKFELMNQTPVSSTADWKTYRNEEYGFEFKYPSTMVLSHDEYGDYFDSSVKDDNLERPVPLFWNIEKTKFKNVDEWLQERYKGRGELMPIKTSITVDGHSAYSIDDPVSIGAPITGIVFIKEGMLYDFTFSLNGAELIDEILSTFKFISTSTSN